jgi:hypothetical protein
MIFFMLFSYRFNGSPMATYLLSMHKACQIKTQVLFDQHIELIH